MLLLVEKTSMLCLASPTPCKLHSKPSLSAQGATEFVEMFVATRHANGGPPKTLTVPPPRKVIPTIPVITAPSSPVAAPSTAVAAPPTVAVAPPNYSRVLRAEIGPLEAELRAKTAELSQLKATLRFVDSFSISSATVCVGGL